MGITLLVTSGEKARCRRLASWAVWLAGVTQSRQGTEPLDQAEKREADVGDQCGPFWLYNLWFRISVCGFYGRSHTKPTQSPPPQRSLLKRCDVLRAAALRFGARLTSIALRLGKVTQKPAEREREEFGGLLTDTGNKLCSGECAAELARGAGKKTGFVISRFLLGA